MLRSWRLAGASLLAVAVVVLLVRQLATAEKLNLAAHCGAHTRHNHLNSAC